MLDEIQRCPALLSWLQGLVDERRRMGDFVLTGSRQFELAHGLTQTLAGRVGRLELLLPLSATTARQWLSVLEASYLMLRLPPYHQNIGKRLVKTPKLYFLDAGLAAWLAGIRAPAQLHTHALRGALFETWVVSEVLTSSPA